MPRSHRSSAPWRPSPRVGIGRRSKTNARGKPDGSRAHWICAKAERRRNAARAQAYPRESFKGVSKMTPNRPLHGQKAIVTGANSGIGRAIALALGAAGADVVVNYRDGEDAAVEVVRQIAQSGSRGVAHRADVSREAEVEELFRRTIEQLGTVDILVNNAGLQRDA